MVYYENQEGRVCILFPYFGNVLVGSTDLKLDDPEGNRCEDSERAYILESLSFIFPKIKIASEEILYVFSGVRPLLQSSSDKTGKISRDHSCRLVSENDGFEIPVLCMIGGKWTTFRAFGEQASDRVMEILKRTRSQSTQDLPIGGGNRFPADEAGVQTWTADLAKRSGLAVATVTNLAERYGYGAEKISAFMTKAEDRPLAAHSGYSLREIEYIIENESVETLCDILCRRTAIAISGKMSLALIEEILDILAQHKGWSPESEKVKLAETLSRLSHYHGLSEETLRNRKIV